MKKITIKLFTTMVIAQMLAAGFTEAGSLFDGVNENEGIEVGASITSVYQRNVKGGLSTSKRQGEFSGSYDIEIDLDLEKIFGIEGGFFIHAEGGWTSSEGINDSSVGSYFGVNDDAIGNRSLDIVEAFYYFDITDGFTLSVGKMDLTGFFDASEYANDEASQFLGGSFVNNSAVPFPDYGLGIVASLQLSDSLYLNAGVADAQADGRETGFNTTFNSDKYYFYIAELGLQSSLQSAKGELGGTYRFGVWNDPQPKASADVANESRDDVGFYVSFDQMVMKENSDFDDDQGLGVFFRYGYADLKRNDLTHFCSFGCQYKGLIAGRDNDVLGLGYSNGSFSNRSATTFPNGYEAAFEAYYNIQVSPQLSICPDIQYIVNSADAGSDAIALGIRLTYDF